MLTLVLLSVALTTGWTANVEASGDSEEDQAQLEIKGSSGTEFSGSCAIGDGEPEEISGEVPESFTYDLQGKSLDCEISSEDDVQVELNVGENVHAVQRFSGGTLNLTYENGSISSIVSSSSGSAGQVSSTSSRVISSSASEIDEEHSDPTNGSSIVTSESRSVSGFDEVELQGVGNLSLQQADSESLTIEAEEDVLPEIRTEVEKDRLIIGPSPTPASILQSRSTTS